MYMKNDEIEKLKNIILNRVRFHAPVVYDEKIDKRVLFENGVDTRYPIFKFDGKLDKKIIKAVCLANLEENFNFLVPFEKVEKKFEKMLKKLKNCVFYSQNSNFSFLTMINKLNINYFSSSNYDLKYKDKFVKINDEIINPKYEDFALVAKGENGVIYDFAEFVLNGSNILLNLKNDEKIAQKVKISLNFPLKNGYYYFKKQNNFVKIVNLSSKEKLFFNFRCPKQKLSFSMVDGLENSLFATIYFETTLTVKPKEEKSFFFSLSPKKLPLKNGEDFLKLLNIAKLKCYETFDIRVKTKNPKFDQFFNNDLPKKIWLCWCNNVREENLSQKYLTLRRLFVKGKEKINFQPFKEIGLKELGIFNGEYFKKILVSFGSEEFLQVGKTRFSNISNITRFSLKKKEPIFLSFDV